MGYMGAYILALINVARGATLTYGQLGVVDVVVVVKQPISDKSIKQPISDILADI